MHSVPFFFPPEASWWARTIDASMIVSSSSRPAASASKTRFQTPDLDQRRKRVCTDFHFG